MHTRLTGLMVRSSLPLLNNFKSRPCSPNCCTGLRLRNFYGFDSVYLSPAFKQTFLNRQALKVSEKHGSLLRIFVSYLE